MAFAHSSVIVTGAAVDTRTRDQLSFPFRARPQAMTVYVQFIEMGTIVGQDFARLFQIGSPAPYFVVLKNPSGSYYLVYNNGFGIDASPTLGNAPTIGQPVELRATLSAAGIPTLGQSIAGGVETTATDTARTLPPAWGSQVLYINSLGAANTGFNAFRTIRVVTAVKTMQEMRRWAGTD